MRVVRSIKQFGAGWLVGGLGLAVGLAFAVPQVAGPGGTLYAVMAGHDGPGTPPATGGPTTTRPPATTPHHGTTAPGDPTTTIPAGSGTKHPTGPTTTYPADPTTTYPTAPTTPPAGPGPAAGPADPATTTVPGQAPVAPTSGALPAGCATARITGLTVRPVDGGLGIVLTVSVSGGDVGWMSAAAEGFGEAALSPVSGGWQGTMTGSSPIAFGTPIVVGTCGGKLRAHTTFGGTGTVGAGSDPTTTVAPDPTAVAPDPTTTLAPQPRSDLPAGCATAAITSVTALLGDGGHAVTVTVMVSADVGWMSGLVNGVGGISLAPIPGGFEGTLTASAPIPAGTTVVVGTCGGKLRASATVGGVPD
jgi:hypothetical protein